MLRKNNITETAVLAEQYVTTTDAVTENVNQSIKLNRIPMPRSEGRTLKRRHHIPMQDYDTLSMEQLVDELQNLVNNDKVMSVKDHVEEIKKHS
jgi:hypothetical protein